VEEGGLSADPTHPSTDPTPLSTGPHEVPPAAPDTPPQPRFGSLAGVTVHGAEPRVLAGLLDRFGAARSFLHDGTWTLVFASSQGR
jgi:hypothetical protein